MHVGAMLEEFNALLENKTFDITFAPPNRKVISGKWVIAYKFNSSNVLERVKARWVARGFEQVDGIDLKETYSPVVKIQSGRFLIAISTRSG
jgi:hypothetical protein